MALTPTPSGSTPPNDPSGLTASFAKCHPVQVNASQRLTGVDPNPIAVLIGPLPPPPSPNRDRPRPAEPFIHSPTQ